MPKDKPKLDKHEVIKAVDLRLEEFTKNKWYGKIVIDLEAGKPIWVKAIPEMRQRVG